MRLIDADALTAVVESARKKAKTLTGIDIVWVIEDQPTVPAITIDWLREKMRGYASTLKSTEMDAVVRVLKMWEEEQEGRT